MKTIVVSGDLLWDYNLVEHSRALNYHSEPLQHTLLHERPGGAWYLKEMVSLACSDLKYVNVRGPLQDGQSARISQAYYLWSQYKRNTERSDKQEQAWRIKQFLGCQQPAKDPAKEVQPIALEGDSAAPHILVLDDLGLGFREHKQLWPAVLQEGRDLDAIVLKTTLPLAGQLWKELKEDKYARRLTVVTSVAALRARRAAISRSFSWDRTIEEIQREFTKGQSAQDLGLCKRVIVHFGVAGAASFKGGEKGADFERFLYHPDEIEGSWLAKRPGKTFGFTSLLTAALVRCELRQEEKDFPLYIALCRGLGAMRVSHDLGGGAKNYLPKTADEQIKQMLRPPKEAKPEKSQSEEAFQSIGKPEEIYFTAYPRRLLIKLGISEQSDSEEIESDLLQNLTGNGLEYVAAKATDVVLRGPKAALREAPKAHYGDYLTVDREEIERINEIRSLIVSYRENWEDKRPLSLAVFGPPGSGKSFAIKQLAKELFGEKHAILEFNLSQFTSVHDLHTAFQKVRDESVQGQIPLVFWDEFDTSVGKQHLAWLKEFLAPMQDAKFQAGSIVHSFGKAIFVFAGGTCPNFQKFDQSQANDKDKQKTKDKKEAGLTKQQFREVKGPDFISRLRGYINIKGPNPVNQQAKEPELAYLIRRAIMLRSAIERMYPHLIDEQTEVAAISASVIRGFLHVKRYLHGARSLEAVVSMSDLNHAPHFSVAELPSEELLRLHVTNDFLTLVEGWQMEIEIVEAIARDCHERWRAMRKKNDWAYGESRSDIDKKHPMIRPYDELSKPELDNGKPLPLLTESEKEKNRSPARLTLMKLKKMGYNIKQQSQGDEKLSFTDRERNWLMTDEHNIWLRDHLLNGYEVNKESNDSLRLHRALVRFDKQLEEDKQLDGENIDSIPDTLWELGYTLVKNQEVTEEPPQAEED